MEKKQATSTPVAKRRRQWGVLTPKTIPKFIIPLGKKSSLQGGRKTQLSREYCTDRSGYSSGSMSLEADEVSSGSTYSRQRRSSDGMSNFSSTDNPGYNLAMTLRHVPKKLTNYGFSTLSSSPSTTPNESMFFSHKMKSQASSEFSNLTCSEMPNKAPSICSPEARRKCNATIHGRLLAFLNSNSNNFPDTTDSSEYSDEDAADGGGLARQWRVLSHSRRRSWAMSSSKRRNGIRMSSQNGNDHDGYSSDQCSLESSPVLSRHIKRPTRRSIEESNRVLALQALHLKCARQLHYVTDIGGIEVALRYDPSLRRLLVFLIRGENIGQSGGLLPNQVHSSVKLNIKSSTTRHQVQKSDVVRNTCDPFFDEAFNFENVGGRSLKNSHLRLQVFLERRGKRLCRKHSDNAGEIWLKLAQVKQNGSMHVKEDLKPKLHFMSPQKSINLGLSYRVKDRMLTVVVVKANHLSNSFMSSCGSDCLVQVQLTQVSVSGDNLVTEKRQTQAKHLNANPVFKETFKFHLNETQNIRDGLMLVCRMVRRNTFRKSAIIGQVQFGIGSTQKSASIQWENLLRHFGQPITEWHNLV